MDFDKRRINEANAVLRRAIHKSDQAEFDVALQRGAQINHVAWGESLLGLGPLALALWWDRPEMVKKLLEWGADTRLATLQLKLASREERAEWRQKAKNSL